VSLLVVGSVAFDALESPYGKVERTVGGAATYFAVAASFFAPVSLVAIVATTSRRRMKLSFADVILTRKDWNERKERLSFGLADIQKT